jgi:hypothetical protein
MMKCRLTSTTSIQSPVMPSDLTSDRGGVPNDRFFKTGDPDVTSSDACPSLTRFKSEFILFLYYLRLVPVVSKMKEGKGIQSTEYIVVALSRLLFLPYLLALIVVIPLISECGTLYLTGFRRVSPLATLVDQFTRFITEVHLCITITNHQRTPRSI